MVERQKSSDRAQRVWVVEVNGQPIVVYPAMHNREAQQLPKEAWFRDDLASLRSNGIALWDRKARLVVRPAAPAEIVEFNQAKIAGDELTLVFLLLLDDAPPNATAI